jgi:hypothetical protein
MLRGTVFIVLAAAIAAFVSPTGSAQPKGIDPGKPVVGDLGGQTRQLSYKMVDAPNGGTGAVHAAEHRIKLKKGDTLTAQVTGLGTDRVVGIFVTDTDNKRIDSKGYAFADIKSYTLPELEVAATGFYTIYVFSETKGGYTLTVGSSQEELTGKVTKKDLEDKIARLKKELKAAEEALEALEKKEKEKK